MLRVKIAALTAFAAVLMYWQVAPETVTGRPIGVPDPCKSTASVVGGPHCWVICPCGDGAPLNNLFPAPGNATITVVVREADDVPIPGIPAADFWLLGCYDEIALCNGPASIDATGPTDANGETTIASAMTAGGCDNSVAVVVQGIVLLDPSACTEPLCLDILVRSPDIDGDLTVDSVDFTFFGNSYEPYGGVYYECSDYDCSGTINSLDFTIFGNHAGHTCGCQGAWADM